MSAICPSSATGAAPSANASAAPSSWSKPTPLFPSPKPRTTPNSPPRTLRPKIHRKLPLFLKRPRARRVATPSLNLVRDSLSLDDPGALCRAIGADDSVPAAGHPRRGRRRRPPPPALSVAESRRLRRVRQRPRPRRHLRLSPTFISARSPPSTSPCAPPKPTPRAIPPTPFSNSSSSAASSPSTPAGTGPPATATTPPGMGPQNPRPPPARQTGLPLHPRPVEAAATRSLLERRPANCSAPAACTTTCACTGQENPRVVRLSRGGLRHRPLAQQQVPARRTRSQRHRRRRLVLRTPRPPLDRTARLRYHPLHERQRPAPKIRYPGLPGPMARPRNPPAGKETP